jgi:hypothetical protein
MDVFKFDRHSYLVCHEDEDAHNVLLFRLHK